MTALEQAIVAAIKARGGKHISFVELGRDDIPGWEGDRSIWIEGNNVVLWSGLSEEAVKAMQSLIDAGIIVLRPSVPLVYLVDGGMLTLPIVSRHRRQYKKPHWLPTCVSLAGYL